LKHILKTTSEVLSSVNFVSDCIGKEAEKSCSRITARPSFIGKLTFHSEEEAEMLLCKTTSGTRDIYVNDAFGTAHRAHASTTIIALFLKNKNVSIIIG
jgi:phosphoglycerate kinase